MERDLSNAENKRSRAQDELLNKLKNHNEKVNKVTQNVASLEKERIESIKEKLDQKLTKAQ